MNLMVIILTSLLTLDTYHSATISSSTTSTHPPLATTEPPQASTPKPPTTTTNKPPLATTTQQKPAETTQSPKAATTQPPPPPATTQPPAVTTQPPAVTTKPPTPSTTQPPQTEENQQPHAAKSQPSTAQPTTTQTPLLAVSISTNTTVNSTDNVRLDEPSDNSTVSQLQGIKSTTTTTAKADGNVSPTNDELPKTLTLPDNNSNLTTSLIQNITTSSAAPNITTTTAVTNFKPATAATNIISATDNTTTTAAASTTTRKTDEVSSLNDTTTSAKTTTEQLESSTFDELFEEFTQEPLDNPTTYNVSQEEENIEEFLDAVLGNVFDIGQNNISTVSPFETTEGRTNSTGASSLFDGESMYSVILITCLCVGIVFFLVVIILVSRRVYDGWQKRHYSRIDYLVNGMYN